MVVEARKKTGYGRKRLAWYLARQEGLHLSPHTLHHILKRNGFGGKRRPRKTFYPAHWAWEQDEVFSLAQVDVKGALGTKLWDHMRKRRLPRYQWTFCEGQSRLRFLLYSQKRHLTNGLGFMALVMLWLRRYGIMREMIWQTDWGEEFGGFQSGQAGPAPGALLWAPGSSPGPHPPGQKGYDGRVERSHRTDDEECYIPFWARVQDEQQLLEKTAGWVYCYNPSGLSPLGRSLVRSHYGEGMEGKPPLARLRQLGYALPEQFALFPPLLLDAVSVDWAAQGGNDLLAHYKRRGLAALCDFLLPQTRRPSARGRPRGASESAHASGPCGEGLLRPHASAVGRTGSSGRRNPHRSLFVVKDRPHNGDKP